MNYITTTQLRTQSSQLVEALKRGNTVSLVHRSKIIGKIQPADEQLHVFHLAEFRKLFKGVKRPKFIVYKKRAEIYRNHLEKKYGPHVY